MDLGIEGRVALVAASSKGLGRAVAEALAAEGCDLVLCARSEGPLESARAAIAEASGRRVLARPTDVADPDDVRGLVDFALERFGRVDILVTNGGGPPPGSFEEHDLRAWREASAVTGLARTLANEVASLGITVNNLMPGYTRTARLEHLAAHIAREEDVPEEAAYARWETQVPAGRIGEPRDFGALAAFLASEQAAYITGQSIAVDGGWIRSLL